MNQKTLNQATLRYPGIEILKALTIMLCLMLIPVVYAQHTGSEINTILQIENVKPELEVCRSRVLNEELTNTRLTEDGDVLRLGKYAFYGEELRWEILTLDKNGVDDINNVNIYLKNSQNDTNDTNNTINLNCQATQVLNNSEILSDYCSEDFDIEKMGDSFNNKTMQFYTCSFIVGQGYTEDESAEGILYAEARDTESLPTQEKLDQWDLNPTITLEINGNLLFENPISPGEGVVSDQIIITNKGSEVALDMYITGEPMQSINNTNENNTNILDLNTISYFAANKDYTTFDDLQVDNISSEQNQRKVDGEGFINIEYGSEFSTLELFRDNAEILQAPDKSDSYYSANILTSDSKLKLTFRVIVPEASRGEYSGNIYIWGEVI